MTFIIEGQAVALERARATLRNAGAVVAGAKKGQFIRPVIGHYLAENSKNWRETIQWSVKAQMAGREVFDGPLKVEYTFYLNKPSSKPKWKRYPDVAPDLSNYVKAVEDAFNAVVIADDGRIVESYEKKLYCQWESVTDSFETTPHVEVTITPLSEPRKR